MEQEQYNIDWGKSWRSSFKRLNRKGFPLVEQLSPEERKAWTSCCNCVNGLLQGALQIDYTGSLEEKHCYTIGETPMKPVRGFRRPLEKMGGCCLRIIILGGAAWLVLRNKPGDAPQELSVPAGNVRHNKPSSKVQL